MDMKLFYRRVAICGLIAVVYFLDILPSKAQDTKIYNPFANTNFSYRNYHFAPFPFDNVVVLDNRQDSSVIAINENGEYPVEIFDFQEPSTVAIQKYIKLSTEKYTTHNTRKLLIDITHLRSFNRSVSLEKFENKKGEIENYLWLTYNRVILSANVYVETSDNHFRKLMEVKDAATDSYLTYSASIKKIIDKLIDATTLYYVETTLPKNKMPFRFKKNLEEKEEFIKSNDSVEVTVPEIIYNLRNRYASLPVNKNVIARTGFYSTFEDFRDNLITKHPIKLSYNPTDSLYTLSANLKDTIYKKHFPFAITDSGRLYIALVEDKYVRLNKMGDGYYFDVPTSLPNMYTILSLEKKNVEIDNNKSNVGAAGGLVGALIIIGFNELKLSSIKKNGNNDQLINNYRHCKIDMDNGDIIY